MKSFKYIIMSTVAAVLVSCGTTNTVPITGRKQSLMVSDGEVLSLSTQQYQEFMKTAKLSTNQSNTAMVKRVGQNLASAVVNTQNEASLAIVLGHEIAHAVARHSAEQMSTQMKQQYGMQVGAALAGVLGMGPNTQSIVQAIAAQGFNFKNLKYSRDHENEADHMGLIFAAMAGYDPQVATTFWQRMAASNQNQTAEFLSDHPSDATRIKNIQGWMPEALKYYKPKTTTTTTTRAATTTKKAATTTKKTTTTKKSTTTKKTTKK